MEYKDYYKIIGLKRDASQDEIKRAYRKLARKYHPDVSKEKDAEARFKEVGEAYEVLKDPEKRAAYDHLGANFKAGQEFHPPPNWDSGFEFRGGGFTDADKAGFSDFFEELFGRQGYGDHAAYRSRFNARGQDHHAKVVVDLEDSFHGATRSISLQSPELDQQGQMRLINRTLNVKIPKGIKEGNSAVLPKSAIMSSDVLDEFWIMKLINDSTAVKVGIEKGIEDSDMVQVLSPKLNADDKIVFVGAYGLPDTANVKIGK